MKRRKKRKQFVIWRYIRLGIFIFIFIVSLNIFFQFRKYQSLKETQEKLMQLYESIKQQNDALDDQFELQNSDQYIEKIAREQLGYIKNNEILIIEKDD